METIQNKDVNTSQEFVDCAMVFIDDYSRCGDTRVCVDTEYLIDGLAKVIHKLDKQQEVINHIDKVLEETESNEETRLCWNKQEESSADQNN